MKPVRNAIWAPLWDKYYENLAIPRENIEETTPFNQLFQYLRQCTFIPFIIIKRQYHYER